MASAKSTASLRASTRAPVASVASADRALPAADAQYRAWRQQAYQTGRTLHEQEQQYLERRARVLEDLDSEFASQVADTEAKHARASAYIQHAQQMALLDLQQAETALRANRALAREEKLARVRALRKRYLEQYEPDDEYRRWVRQQQQHSLEGMMRAMLVSAAPALTLAPTLAPDDESSARCERRAPQTRVEEID